MAFKLFAVLAFILTVGDASANKYLRRASETKGVFPVLEAREEYDLNKREFSERQSTGVATDCQKCPPFNPNAIEDGETHCAPGLKPVKRCDVKCGCESWDCVRENCDIWIKANAANFTGPCLNDATGEVDSCETRSRVEWNCGCKIMACEKKCKPVTTVCDKECSSQVYDECSCQTEKCEPYIPPVAPEPLCETSADCPNPECSKCVETKPFGEKCGKLFPGKHIVKKCIVDPPTQPSCDICKYEVAEVTGEDKCGHLTYTCVKKPEGLGNGTCEWCEKVLGPFPMPVNSPCPGKKEGDKVTLCEKNTDATPAPCEEHGCDFCVEDVVTGEKSATRCAELECQKTECVPANVTPLEEAKNKKCCSGDVPAGKLQKVRDHEKCDKEVCVLDCKLRESLQRCDTCTEMKRPTGKKDDCGCEIHECVGVEGPQPMPEGGCKDCLKEITVSKNPANPDCKEMVKTCVKKTAIYQIVESKDDLKIPEDPSDPTGKYDDIKKDLFEPADEQTIKDMDPESFLEELKKLPEDEPALLDGDKVVLKKLTTTPAPGEPTTTPAPGEPQEYSVVPLDDVKEEKPVSKKVFVFILNKCPALPEITECHQILGEKKICDCTVHKEKLPVEQCEKEKCPSKCIPVTKPVVPTGKCQHIEMFCQPECKDVNLTKCDAKEKVTEEETTIPCTDDKGKKTCLEQRVTMTTTMVKVVGNEECCEESKTKSVGECKPKVCKETTCDETCQERRVVKEEDECGCAEYECVPITTCKQRCGECEECMEVEDSEKQCKTFQCTTKQPPKPEQCQRYKTVKQDGEIIVLEDKCGNPVIEKDCPVPTEFPLGCPEGTYKGKVRNSCDCPICKDDKCCIKCLEIPAVKCTECQVKERKNNVITECPEETCKPNKCPPLKTPNCPSCDKAEVKEDKCGCVTTKCVPRPCPKVDKSLKCKQGEKLEVEKNGCGCLVYKCVKQEVCREECKAGEEAKLQKVFMCKEISTACRHQRAKALARSVFVTGTFVPECGKAGLFATRQRKGSNDYCVDPKTGVKLPGTEGAVGTVKC